MTIDKLQQIKDSYLQRIAEIEAQIEELQKQEPIIVPTELSEEERAKLNALSAIFDGVKYIANTGNPYPVTFPMQVYANMFYTIDGKEYTCFRTGVITEENYLDYLDGGVE